MSYDPKRVSQAFQRLFATYQSFLADGAEEGMRAYYDAVAPYATQDIEAAVRNFLAGTAPGHNPAWAPPAPLVGAETRRVMNLRLDSEARDRLARPRLPPPDIEHTPASKARVAALVVATANKLSANSLRPKRVTAGDPEGDGEIA